MILLDVSVLVYAFTSAEPLHEPTLAWLERTLSSTTERVGLSESAVSGFVRIVTNPRIYASPATTRTALDFVDAIIATGRASWLPPNDTTWQTFGQLIAADRQIKANLVPDAWLAALAVCHGARLATADRGFARFEGLRLVDPTR